MYKYTNNYVYFTLNQFECIYNKNKTRSALRNKKQPHNLASYPEGSAGSGVVGHTGNHAVHGSKLTLMEDRRPVLDLRQHACGTNMMLLHCCIFKLHYIHN